MKNENKPVLENFENVGVVQIFIYWKEPLAYPEIYFEAGGLERNG